MHYYKRNIGDYHKKAGRLTMVQHGAYSLLMDSIYDREKFPTKEEAIDWVWASSKEELEAVEFVLKKFFTLEGEVYNQTRMSEEIEEYTGLCISNKINGKKGGRPKGSKNKPKETQPIIKETQRVNNKTQINPTESDSNPNQEPLTINQEPVTKEKTISPSGSSIEIDQPDLIGDLESYSKTDKQNKIPRNWTQSLIDVYHECLPDWPHVEIINDDRKKAAKRAWKFTENSNTIEFWKGMFLECKGNSFMEGDNNRGWKGSFDYLLTNKTMVKIYEGNQPR